MAHRSENLVDVLLDLLARHPPMSCRVRSVNPVPPPRRRQRRRLGCRSAKPDHHFPTGASQPDSPDATLDSGPSVTVALRMPLQARVFRATCSSSAASDSVGELNCLATLRRGSRNGRRGRQPTVGEKLRQKFPVAVDVEMAHARVARQYPSMIFLPVSRQMPSGGQATMPA